MKTITINVSDPVYREFQQYARQNDRKAAQLIRDAMQLYRDQNIRPSREGSLTALPVVSVGAIKQALSPEDDLLDEMTHVS